MWVANTADVKQLEYSSGSKLWVLQLTCGASMRSPFVALGPDLVYASEDGEAELVCLRGCQLDCIVRVCSGKVEPSVAR